MSDTIPEMLWSATPEGAIDYCNGRMLEYTGVSAADVMGTGWTKLLHPDDVEDTARVWVSCVTTGAPYRVEVRTFHATFSFSILRVTQPATDVQQSARNS
jgi:PAS domain S-box-containing protein